MKVKAVDIARKLNISKATVSLALNNRPGVSEKTKEKILQCINEMNGEKSLTSGVGKQVIKMIVVNNNLGNIHHGMELDLWADSFEVFDREIKSKGYTLGLTYVNPVMEELEQAVREANEPNVAGVILNATEMTPGQFEPLKKIQKPMVIYDNDLSNAFHCVVIDGVGAARDSVDYLVSRGCRDIKYLGNTVDLYNFRQRRAGYRAGLRKNRLELKDDSIVLIGDKINCVRENMRRYLDSHRLPDAFLMENYQVSIGVIQALKERKISVPQDVSLIGIDEIPGYLIDDMNLTTVRVVHAERAQVVMMFLEEEINGVITHKFKAYSNCELIRGNSVR